MTTDDQRSSPKTCPEAAKPLAACCGADGRCADGCRPGGPCPRQPAWIGAIAFPVGCAVWLVGTLWTDSLADGAVLTVAEGTLPVFSFAGALAVVGGGLVWPRLAGVAGIAGLAGVVSYLFQGASSVVHVGLVAAIGFLAWVAPRTRPRKTPGSSETAARSPADGGDG